MMTLYKTKVDSDPDSEVTTTTEVILEVTSAGQVNNVMKFSLEDGSESGRQFNRGNVDNPNHGSNLDEELQPYNIDSKYYDHVSTSTFHPVATVLSVGCDD